MEQPLITISGNDEGNFNYNRNYHTVTFRQCLRMIGGKQESQRKLFMLMASYWIFASFFISIQFFLYKKPVYCESVEMGNQLCCHQGDNLCIQSVCMRYQHDIMSHILPEHTLSYQFQLFCEHDNYRFLLKIFPETLSFIGFIVYGTLADFKGRKTAINISWRMFTFGVVTYAITQATYFKLLGYIIASIHCLPSLVIQFVLFFQQNIQKSRNRSCLLLLACLFVGPLVLSLSSTIISKLDNRANLFFICAFPSLILSVLVNKINESAVYTYPYDKLEAFNILNSIARDNGREPIFIDLSRSYWHKYSNLSPVGILSLFTTKSVRTKLVLGFLFMFANYFNMKMAQISLDTYTTAYNRSILISIPTALADITLCVFLVRFQHRTCKSIFMAIIWLLGILMLCHWINLCWQVMRVLVVTHSMIIRYLSQLCYGIMIIWSIQTFPTINRTTCTTLVFGGTAVGCSLAYLLRNNIQVLFCISIFNTMLMMFFEKYLNLHKYGIMIDTFDREYYDENDKFYKF